MERLTEMPNPLTSDLDSYDTAAAVRALRACDGQLFDGSHGLEAMTDAGPVRALACLTTMVQEVVAAWLAGERAFVVMTGSGTSGRLAFATARTMNAALGAPSGDCPGPFGYLIAGGPHAILAAHENAEDVASAGAMDLSAFVHRWSATRLLVVAVSCGLSATYGGSQVAVALRAAGIKVPEGGDAEAVPSPSLPDGVAVRTAILGFNTTASVRRVVVPGWRSTFEDVLGACLAEGEGWSAAEGGPGLPRACVLHPAVGPEAIAGSTRMKGGSATKILLETACLHGAAAARAADAVTPGDAGSAGRAAARSGPVSEPSLLSSIRRFRGAVAAAYEDVAALAELSDAAGASLRSGGRVMYLGCGQTGLLGVIDASECPPTYGAGFDDVRAAWEDANSPGNVPTAHVAAALVDAAAGVAAVAAAAGAAPGAPEATAEPHDGDDDAAESSWSAPTRLSRLDGSDGAADDAAGCGGLAKAGPRAPMRAAGAKDVLILLEGRGQTLSAASLELAGRAARGGAVVAAILAGPGHGDAAAAACTGPVVSLGLADPSLLAEAPVLDSPAWAAPPCPLAGLAVKLALNAVTTVAHVSKGCVLGNRMVNLRVTNRKLFFRAAKLVADASGTDLKAGTLALIAAIHGVDAPSASLCAADAAVHVSAAAPRDLVVPAAIVVAKTGCAVGMAYERLRGAGSIVAALRA